MRRKTAYPLVITGLLTAVGLILPYVTAHGFGMPGTLLLPMHLPVLLCGLLCGPYYGALSGLVIPVLSSLLTSMPVLYPMLPIMAAQLMAMGTISGLLYRKGRWPLILAQLTATLSGWVCYGLIFGVLLMANDGTLKALTVTAAVIKGLPGMAIQLVLVSLLVSAVNKSRSGRELGKRKEVMDRAKDMIRRKEASCVVTRDGAILYTGDGRGISPLIRVYENDPDKLAGSAVADRIIGKAAAMVLVLGGVSAAYGEVMSAAARDYLESHGIAVSFGRCVEMISSRDKTGICPIEQSVLEIDDPAEGYTRIKNKIQTLAQRVG